MPMRRREKHVTGYVRFPVDDPAWEFSREGGMFVRLMVPVFNRHPDAAWMECCGGLVQVQLDETAVFDDELFRHLWPRMFDANGEPREDHTPSDYLSVPCLTVVTLGSTGWAGHRNGNYWRCGEKDLTDAGRQMVNLVRKLYPAHAPVLTTWLDT